MITDQVSTCKNAFVSVVIYIFVAGNITVFDRNGTELGKITIIESNLDDFEKKAKPVLPPFLAFSMSGTVEVSRLFYKLQNGM